jgi:hypothetical protein
MITAIVSNADCKAAGIEPARAMPSDAPSSRVVSFTAGWAVGGVA